MLSGQVIDVGSAIVIAITGIFVVMLELGLLAGFIVILSKVVNKASKKVEPVKAVTPAPVPAPTQQISMNSEDDDDLAVVMAVVLEECGLEPHEVNFNFITRIQ